MTRVLALAGQSKIGLSRSGGSPKPGPKPIRNGVPLWTETACRFPPKPPAGLNRNRLSETPKFAVSAKHLFELPHQCRPLVEPRRVMRPPRPASTAEVAEVEAQKSEAFTSLTCYRSCRTGRRQDRTAGRYLPQHRISTPIVHRGRRD